MLFTFFLCHTLQDEISSPISAQIFELCDPEFFQESLQNSDVTSTSNCCHDQDNNNNNNSSSYAINISQALDLEDHNINNNSNSNNSNNSNNNTNSSNNNNLSIIFDSQQEIDNDISASIDFSSSPSFLVPPLLHQEQQQQFDFSSSNPHQLQQLTTCSVLNPIAASAPLIGVPFASVFEDDCISSIPSYVPINPSSVSSSSPSSCSYLSSGLGVYMPHHHGNLSSALSADSSSLFGGTILLGSDIQTQELDYQGENGGMYCTDSVQQVFNPQDFQV